MAGNDEGQRICGHRPTDGPGGTGTPDGSRQLAIGNGRSVWNPDQLPQDGRGKGGNPRQFQGQIKIAPFAPEIFLKLTLHLGKKGVFAWRRHRVPLGDAPAHLLFGGMGDDGSQALPSRHQTEPSDGGAA
jgi:hypothetical protein